MLTRASCNSSALRYCASGAQVNSLQSLSTLLTRIFPPKAKPIDKGGASDEDASAEGVGAKELITEGVPPKANKMTRSFFPVTKAFAAHASYVFSDISSEGVCAEGASFYLRRRRIAEDTSSKDLLPKALSPAGTVCAVRSAGPQS
ncbi:hypothetical protein AXG93_1104s1180 [Marchantia polymorpha subsp. ruderalis]|uniref:Uncharacterized protein n=1 Tax=Marchantia polymorpha subsp. ruderalis TaxID=1480154 RepID=A0A176WNQ7_MARPO|nr:hypothetical protein AXG93_1104s1180 [Marchantia polymorpha subsp. ruderalis]